MSTMKTRIALCFSLCLCLTGILDADTQWNATASNLWSNPANWNNGLPDASQKAQFATSEVCILDFAGAVAKHIAMDGAGAGHLRLVDGAELSVKDWTIIGYSESNVGEMACLLEVFGGVLNCEMRSFVGFLGEGTMVVDGDGIANILSQDFGVGQNTNGNGTVELRGGALNIMAGTLVLRAGANAQAHVDFSGGIMTLPNVQSRIDVVNGGIADGTITAYDGQGEVILETDDNGRLVVKGLHSLKPVPMDEGRGSAGALELRWVLPDPCQPGQQVPVNVYFGTSPEIGFDGSAETPQIISQGNVSSVVVQTQPKTRYYWAVDAYVGSDQDPVLGPVFSFVADNLVPAVDAGGDVLTWMTNGSVDVALDATVTDDGFLQPYGVQWTVVSEPNEGMAVLGDAGAEDAVVTLSAAGQYVLRLEANDGEYTGSDTVTVNVYNDSCEAAQSLPDFVPLPGDLNGDCVVNDLDLAILEAHWLECNALDCNDVDL